MSVFDDLAADAMASAPEPHTAVTRRVPVLLELHPSPHKAAAAVDVIQLKGREFRPTHAGGIEHLQDGPISPIEVVVRIRRLQQASGLLDGEVVGELPLSSGRLEMLRGIPFEDALCDQESEVGPGRGPGPSYGSRSQALIPQREDPAPQVIGAYMARSRDAHVVEVCQQLPQVPQIGLDGPLRESTLEDHMLAEEVDAKGALDVTHRADAWYATTRAR